MKYTNSVAIIRTRKGNTVGCHIVHMAKKIFIEEWLGITKL